MNKLYLLALLGVAVQADVTSDVTGVDGSSNGWYAGDCLDEDDFSSYYGSVEYDCGTECNADDGDDTDGTDDTTDDTTDYSDVYPDCYNDTATEDEELLCV